ncbi:MAG: hypothetical protein ACP5G2_07735 [Candidatus Bipolaricaulaceae bacterium]
MAKLGTVALLVALAAAAGGAAPVELHFFWAVGCPQCELMRESLDGLGAEFPELTVVPHEVTYQPEEWRLMVRLAQAYKVEAGDTPLVVVGELALSGYSRAVELRVREEVERCADQGCPSPLTRLPAEENWWPSPLELSLLALAGVAVLWLLVQLTAD